jgi:predicted XRE-type DNA-binding protein
VFADLAFPDAAEHQAKLRLAYALNQVLDARKLSQADAAKVLGVTQPEVSALRHCELAGCSVERLMNLLTALDISRSAFGIEATVSGRFLNSLLVLARLDAEQPGTSTASPR